jgi:predicted P-loop ATPase
MAWENRYHPIQEYLTNLKWDGHDHISRLVHDYLDEPTNFGEVVFTRWMLGCIAKVFQADYTRNFMMVWDGEQRIGKSSLARWLCPLPRYFVESQLQPDNKDHQVWALQNWIWEVGELQATTRRADKEALKHFITQREITVRKAFGKNELTGPMLCNFIGTINNDGNGFLSDPTGNTRFVTIFIKSINHAYSQEMDVNQLWAQAMHHYNQGMRQHLSPEEQLRSNEINEEYKTTNPVTEFFWECYTVDAKSTTVISSIEIVKRLEGAGLKGNNQNQNLKDLGALLRNLPGVKKEKPRTKGKGGQIRGYSGIVEL